MLEVVFGLQGDTFKVTSNAKILNMKVVRLVETNNFAVELIFIGGAIRPPDLKYEPNNMKSFGQIRV